AQALQDAGYATDPGYAQKIIQVIETYQLNQYDRR
ncbi:glucosaminidase domain-containing protein, partial [Enterococcus faecium]